jgi:hypothetical protein
MHADELVELLGGVQQVSRGKWNASCPAHLDKSPSLTVTEGVDRVLVHCHAGCALGKILLELGLDWRDIFHDTPQPPPIVPPGKIYVGYDTPPEYRVGRPRMTSSPGPRAIGLPEPEELEKWIRQVKVISAALKERKGWTSPTLRHFELGWDGKRVTIPVRDAHRVLVSLLRYLPSALEYKMLAPKGAGRHLFPPPERLKVDDVWLVEGEPDAISAFELELPAVGVPGVATWKADWTARFWGRSVTICFDCDVQGREAAEQRRADFEATGIAARVVDLAPTKHDGYDLGDAMTDAITLGRVPDLRKYLGRLMHEAWA